MKHKIIITAAALATTLSLSNCTWISQIANPAPPKGYIAATDPLRVDTTDCKVVCARATGESTGLKILGLIPVKDPSESKAVELMYQNVQDRGAKIEGETRFFANTAIERSSKYYVLFSIPKVTVSGDLVQYVSNHHYGVSK